MHSILFFCKKRNIVLTVLFLIFIKIDSFGFISLDNKLENNKDNSERKILSMTKDLFKNSNENYENNLEKLLEDFFLNENDEIFSELKNEFNELKQEIFISNNQEKETENKDGDNYFKDIETNKNSIVSINSIDNIPEILNDYCSKEITNINEITKKLNKTLGQIDYENQTNFEKIKNINNEIDELKKKLNEKNSQIEQGKNFLNKNDTNKIDYFNKKILVIDSVINLINSYFDKNYEKNFEEKNKISKKMLNITNKHNFLQKYSLSTFLSQLISNKNFDEDLFQDKILKLLFDLKKKYEEKEKESMKGKQTHLEIKRLEIENHQKLINSINSEISGLNNDLDFIQKSQKNNEFLLIIYKDLYKKMNVTKEEIRIIC